VVFLPAIGAFQRHSTQLPHHRWPPSVFTLLPRCPWGCVQRTGCSAYSGLGYPHTRSDGLPPCTYLFPSPVSLPVSTQMYHLVVHPWPLPWFMAWLSAVIRGYIPPFGLFPPVGFWSLVSTAQQRFDMAISRRLGYFLPWGAGPCAISFVISGVFVYRPAAVRHVGSFRLWVAPPIYIPSVCV
jgi:hypothetical protein